MDYVKQRRAFGGVLWDREVVRQRMAQLFAEVEAARHLVYHCAWLDSQGRECVKETSMIKVICGELVNKVTYDCVQFHGGAGYMRETAVERMSRDARVQAIGGGATEVMREEIAKRL
jgi:acyl-CoA dehydrogenase